MLPGVNFKIENGALGGQDISEDGVAGLMMSGKEGAVGVSPSWVLFFTPPGSEITQTLIFPDGSTSEFILEGGLILPDLIDAFASQFPDKEGWSFDGVDTISGPISIAETIVSGDLLLTGGEPIPPVSIASFDAGVKPGIELEKQYKITRLSQAEDLGITEVSDNAFAYGHIKEFYTEAAEGSELYLFLVDETVTMSAMLDKDNAFLPSFMLQTKGRVRKLGVSRDASILPITSGFSLDADVYQAVLNGEESRKYYAAKMMPFRLIVDGKNFDGDSEVLKDYRAETSQGVAILMSSVTKSSNASVGLMLGSYSQQPVQRKVSRKKNGKLSITTAYMTSQEDVEVVEDIWEDLHKKGYVFIRTYPNQSGYYFSSDTTCTSLTDDYSSLSRGAVIDKAMLIAYDVFIEEVDDEIDTDDDGNLDAGQLKDLQSTIEETLKAKMVNNKECTSVLCVIDPAQNTVSSGELAIVLRVKPRGYKTYINVSLGFTL